MRTLIVSVLGFALLAMPVFSFADGSETLPVPTKVSCDQATHILLLTQTTISQLDKFLPRRWLGGGTCYIWQQPGVALVITDEWQTDSPPPELMISADKLSACFEADLKPERPPLRITEEYALQHGGVDGLAIEPAAYLLDAEAAAERIAMYADGLETWAGMNEGADFIMPSAASLAPSCAFVYLDSSGPLEFYFTENADSSLSLAHIIFFDFFSA